MFKKARWCNGITVLCYSIQLNSCAGSNPVLAATQKIGVIMQIFYPCKKCIIKSICEIRCIEEKDYWETRNSIFSIIAKVLCIASFITIFSSLLKKGI